jgi:hypothetical protein
MIVLLSDIHGMSTTRHLGLEKVRGWEKVEVRGRGLG